jgi:hypothetical protein
LFSLKELEIFLRSKSNSYVDRTNFRDLEQEKSIWVAFIADLLKSSWQKLFSVVGICQTIIHHLHDVYFFQRNRIFTRKVRSP